jgi:hypothetical protein
MGAAQGKKVAAPPLRKDDRGAAVLWPDRVIDETASVACHRPAGKLMHRWGHARAGVAEREISNPRARKGSSHSEPRLPKKMQSPTLVGSTISACSIASPQEQPVLGKLDGRYGWSSPAGGDLAGNDANPLRVDKRRCAGALDEPLAQEVSVHLAALPRFTGAFSGGGLPGKVTCQLTPRIEP